VLLAAQRREVGLVVGSIGVLIFVAWVTVGIIAVVWFRAVRRSRRTLPQPPSYRAVEGRPVGERLAEVDRMLAADQISPAEHDAWRARILGTPEPPQQ
jgi:hypothetical protein